MNDEPQAVIDIGTNTIRLLVARCQPEGGLQRLLDETATVRLGHGVDRSGRLTADRMTRAAQAVAIFTRRARDAGARTVQVIATSAVRDAANRAEFVALVADMAGLPVTVIDGDREAALTYRGAMWGRQASGWQLVADIGGGSTEVILAVDGVVQFAVSLQLGSGRLTECCLPGDPPTGGEVAAAQQHITQSLAHLPTEAVREGIVVGGTGSTLLHLTPRAPGDAALTRAQLDSVLSALLSRSALASATAWGIDPERARVLPGGILIMQALMQRYGLEAVAVSRGSIREGLLLELAAQSAQESVYGSE